MFYVYGHYRPNEDRPFYVGKGLGKRSVSRNGRSEWWKRIVAKNFPETGVPIVKMLSKNVVDESLAFDLEAFWIALFGRKNLDEGCLINHTNGGEGCSGMVHSESTKRRMAAKAMGRKHTPESLEKMSIAASLRTGSKNTFYGRKHSAESLAKISKNNASRKLDRSGRLAMAVKKGALPVSFQHNDGRVVEIINKKEFCREYNVGNAHLYEVIRGSRPTANGWHLLSPQ